MTEKTSIELEDDDVAVVVDKKGELSLFFPATEEDDDSDINEGQLFLVYCAMIYKEDSSYIQDLKKRIFEVGEKISNPQ